MSTVLDGRIHVFGGEVTPAQGPAFGCHFSYDPEADEWSQRLPLPTGRHGLAVATLDSRIFTAGGGPMSGFSQTEVHSLAQVDNPAPQMQRRRRDVSTHPDALPGTATSKDGTTIAYDRVGSGPPLIMVLGAFNNRFTGAPLAKALADRVSVFNYDRRGRGDSGDTVPYAVEREIEDMAALLDVVGGPVSVFGFSSGAVLALRAAAAGVAMDKLILFGTPLISDATRSPPLPGMAEQIKILVQDDRRGEAVELFQRDAVGMPQELIEEMRNAPFRPALEAMAHTWYPICWRHPYGGSLPASVCRHSSGESPTQ